MNPRTLITVVYAVTGLMLSTLSIPMILRKVKPNPFYGFRVPKTLNNPDIWYEINAYSGRRLFVTGLVAALAAACLDVFAPGLDMGTFSTILAVIVVVTLGVTLVQSFRRLSQM